MGTYTPMRKKFRKRVSFIYVSACIVVLFFTYIFLNWQNMYSIVIALTVLVIIALTGLVLLFLRMNQAEKYYTGLINSGRDKSKLQNNYEKLLRNANDMIIISDEKGDVKFMNLKALSAYGYSPKEALMLNIKEIRADSELFDLTEFRKMVLDSEGTVFETLHKQKDGTVFPVEVSVQIIELDGERYAQELIRNITEHKKAQRKTAQLNRVYSVLSNVNQMIVRIKDKSDLFKGACEIAVKDGGFRMVWVGIVDPVTGDINIVSSTGITSQYLDNLKINLNESGTLTGLIGKSIKSGQYEVCNDIEKEPLMIRNVDEALKNNYHSVATFPLKSQGQITGFINLYSDRVNFFTQEEIKLLDEMASDISYAIEFLDNENVRTITENALRESEERMKVIIEGTPHLFFYVQDKDANIKYISPSVEKITGYSIEEWLKRKDWFITGNEMNLKAIKATHAHLDGNFTVNPVHLEISHAGGYAIFLEVYEYPILNNGIITGLQGVAHDITEKLKVEKALKESEERWSFALEGSNDGVWDWSPDTNKIFFSKRWKEMLGYRDDELSNEFSEWENRVHPDDLEYVLKELQKHLKGDVPYYKSEHRMLRKDGKYIWVLDRGKVISRTPDGKPLRVVGTHSDISELKLTEENLRVSEERYRTLYESSMIGIYRTTPEGKILLANPALLKMLGYSSFEELTARNLQEEGYEPEYNRNEFIKEMERNGKVVGFESAWKKTDGTLIYVRENARAFSDTNGKILYYDGIVEDVTDRIKALEEINKLSQAVEQSPVSIIITDIKGNIEYVNPKLCELTGYKKEEVIGQNPRILKSGHTSPKEYKKLWEAISSGKEWRGEFLDKKKDGTFIWESASISPILNNAGKITHYLAVKEDITERKKTEQLILKSEVEFRSVWESSVDAMRLCDMDGKMLRVNNAYCKLFEMPENELVGQIYQIVYKYKNDASKLFKENVMAKRIITKQESEVELWNGKKKWLEISNSTFEINNSIMILSIFRDISERKKYEVELQAAKEKAEEVNKTKDLFLANMSHELRTPLIGILGYSDMLAENLSDAENVDMAKGIARSGKRLLNTLNLLLDLTKIESDKVDAEISIINIVDEIRFVFNMFKGIALEKGLDYSLAILKDDLTAKVDAGMLRVILENLINNAVKFTKTGSISIIAGQANSENIFIKVEDTGIGIDEKNFNKIFEEFRQVSEGTNREFQGTGLGLAIAKKYTEILNGTIKLNSKLGTGSSFTITLPAG